MVSGNDAKGPVTQQLTVGRLIVEFVSAGDRWEHRLGVIDLQQAIDWQWIASMPRVDAHQLTLQEIQQSPNAAEHTSLLGVGAAEGVYWSIACSPTSDEQGIEFEVAARYKQHVGQLCSSYAAWSGQEPEAKTCSEVLQAVLEPLENAQLQMSEHAVLSPCQLVDPPATVTWKYRWQLSRPSTSPSAAG